MFRQASLYLAICYLKPRRSFISVITFLSVIGPILGVAVLIIVISVMAGFNRDIRDKILGMQAHIQLKNISRSPIVEPRLFIEKLRSWDIAAAPAVDGPVLIQGRNRVLAKYVKGIQPELERNVTDIEKCVVKGRYEIAEYEVLIGNELASQCNLHVGDRFLIHSPEKLNKMVKFDDDGQVVKSANSEVYTPEEVTVAGIFSLGMYEYDSEVIVVHLDKADELFGMDWGAATSIQLKTADPFHLDPVIERIRRDDTFSGLIPVTWISSNERLFGALQVEKNLMFFLLIFIMIVAAFGIAATLITIVIQKTKEIGILKALGATPFTILSIFVLQGVIVGVIGTTLGTALGLFVVENRNVVAELIARILGTEIFPKDLYHLSQIPALVQTSDIVTIVVSAISICILGTFIPALYAASLSPANALRNEL